MSEPSSSAPAELAGLALDACEWLPSSSETGLLRVRARWTHAPADPELPWLWIRSHGASHRFDSLPDARLGRGPGVWRGTYLVPAGVLADRPDELWLAWPSGARVALPEPTRDAPPLPGSSAAPAPDDRGAQPSGVASAPPAPAPSPLDPAPSAPPAPAPSPNGGGELVDHAVLADRRARRAEASEREQTRVTAGALRAIEVLEQRLEALRRERDELAAAAAAPESPAASSAGELTAARAAARAAEQRLSHSRDALSAALTAGARLRGQAREWRLQLRTSELVRSGEAMRLAVLQPQRSPGGDLREQLDAERRERTAEAAAFAAEREQAQRALDRARRDAADATAALERARRDHEARLAEAAASERELRELLASRHSAQEAAQAALSEREHQIAELRTQVAAVRAQLETAAAEAGAREAELERRLRVLEDALDDERRALVAARGELESQRARLAAAEAIGRAEAVARAALDEQLDRERAARRALAAALDAAREAPPDLRAELRAAHAQAQDARAEAATLHATLETLGAELTAARETARIRLDGLAADLATERARRTALEERLAAAEGQGGSLTARIAEFDRGAARPAGALELQRQAREQAAAAVRATAPEAEQAQRVAADLDAAAAALRARMPAPADDAPPATDVEPPDEDAPASGEPEPVSAEVGPVSAAAAPASGEVGPASADAAPPSSAGDAPHRLRGALVRVAREDPATAAGILAGLLPAQAPVLPCDADYDVTIGDAGTYAVTVASGCAEVRRLDRPRGRRRAEFHLRGDAHALAELLAGAGPRVRRFSGPVRASGRRRRARPLLDALAGSRQSLVDALRAGAQLDADLLFPALAHAIDPAWVRGHAFTVEHRTGDSTWYLVARDVGGLTVTRAAPAHAPDATVTMTPATFQRLLRGDPVLHGERPSVRGDRLAVELLRRWMDRARGLPQPD